MRDPAGERIATLERDASGIRKLAETYLKLQGVAAEEPVPQ